jgi:serine/threonine protein kinase
MISLLEPSFPKLNEKSMNNSTDSKRFLSQQKLNECVISKDDTTNELIKRNLEIIGKIDSKFYLIKKLGKGSYSKVYLGVSIEQLETKNTKDEIKFYSIKVINPIKSDISMFKNEVEFLENIEHDNILKIYAYGAGIKSKIKDEKIKEKKIFYIVMEYIDHGELLNYITKVSPFESKGFGEDLGKLIFFQLLDGLEEIHSKKYFS